MAAASLSLLLVLGAWTARPSYAALRGMVTAHPGGVVLRADVFVPAAAGGPSPAVILVHGGAWRGGDRTYLDLQAQRLAQRGWVAATIDYRTGAAAPFPAELDDVEAGVRWLRAHATSYNVDPRRVALLGESAGGNLAVLTALDATRHPERTAGPVAAAVSWSGPMDLRSMVAGGDATPAWLRAAAHHFVGCDVADCAPRYAAASPLEQVVDGAPPVLLAGSLDEIVPASQARAMARRLSDHGVPVELQLLPGSRHAVGYAGDLWESTTAFLAAALHVPSGTERATLASPTVPFGGAAALLAVTPRVRIRRLPFRPASTALRRSRCRRRDLGDA
jgi:acetyl esterase/lipase